MATIGYRRVSTEEQNTDRQLDGIACDRTYTDIASGKDADREELKACLESLGEGDKLIVHSMDRLGRSTRDLLNMVDNLTNRGATVEFVTERLTFTKDKSDPCSQLMFQVFAAVAEFERTMMLKRQREGIAKAKAKGTYRNRPSRWSLTDTQASDIARRLAAGESATALADEFDVSRATIYNMKARAEKETP